MASGVPSTAGNCSHVGSRSAKPCQHCDVRFCAKCEPTHKEHLKSDLTGQVTKLLRQVNFSPNIAKQSTANQVDETKKRVEAISNKIEEAFRRVLTDRKTAILAIVDQLANEQSTTIDELAKKAEKLKVPLGMVQNLFPAGSLANFSLDEIASIYDQTHLLSEEIMKWEEWKDEVTYSKLCFDGNKLVPKEMVRQISQLPFEGAIQWRYDESSAKRCESNSPSEKCLENESPASMVSMDKSASVDFSQVKQIANKLNSAVSSGNLKQVKQLLASISQTNDGIRLALKQCDDLSLILHQAAFDGQLDIVRYLVEEIGMDVSARSRRYGFTVIHDAVASGNLKVVQYLAKCEPSLCEVKTTSGLTLLHLAADHGYPDIARFLLKQKNRNINSTSDINRTPLHCAAISGHSINTVKVLVENGADVGAKDKVGFTPLHEAAFTGHEEITRYLLRQEGVDINCKTETGRTPLHSAAMAGHVRIAEMLLDRGADICARESTGDQPIHAAVGCGKIEVVKLLLRRKPDLILAKNLRGDTPLAKAQFRNSTAIIELLQKAEEQR